MAPKIYIIFYSMYGHVYKMAQAVKRGVEEAGGEAHLFQVAETLPEEVLTKMHAPPKPDVPVIAPSQLTEADGFIFGIPTRYGAMPAQMKAFFDATGSLWTSGALVGKFTAIFQSTSTLGGGQETTALTSLSNLVHHGVVFVPLGYTHPYLMNIEEPHGGSPWGAGTFTGPTGARQPSDSELEVATHQGAHFTRILNAYVTGKAALAAK